MYLTTIISVVFVLALSLIIRSVDIFRFHAVGIDTFANLLYSKRLKTGSLNLHKVGKIVYPPLLPRLLYYLEGWLSVRILHVIPKLFDVLTSITVFLFTLWFLGNEFVAFLALLIYTFSPINVINGYGIGTRNIGSFFFVFTILASYVAMLDAQVKYIMFVLATASCILMMLTSRIAYKSYFLLVIVTAILLPLNNVFGMFLLVSVISLVLCLLVTRGKFIDDLRGHIFLIHFFRNRRGKEESLTKRTALVFYYDLWWCVGILTIISGADMFFATWLCTIIAISFLWPWGEGERHIALGAAPASIFAASYLSQQPFIIIPLLLLEIFIIVRHSIKVLRGQLLVSVDELLLSLFNAIKQIEGDSLFLCLPTVYSAPVAYFTDKKVLYGENSSQEGILFQAEVLDAIKTQSGLEDLALKYSVTHLFVDKNNFPLTISSDCWDRIIQEERFIVLRRRKLAPKISDDCGAIRSTEVNI
jgi:hypothetical protein